MHTRIFLVLHENIKNTCYELQEASEKARLTCWYAFIMINLTSFLNLRNRNIINMIIINKEYIYMKGESALRTRHFPLSLIQKTKLFHCHITSFRSVIAVLGNLMTPLDGWRRSEPKLSQDEWCGNMA